MTNPDHASCYARLDADRLIMGNGHFERHWRVDEMGLLFALQFHDRRSGRQWIGEPARWPAPYPQTPPPAEPRALSLQIDSGIPQINEAPSLRATLTAKGAIATLIYRFQIFPSVAGVRIELTVAEGMPAATLNADRSPTAAMPTGDESKLAEAAKSQSPRVDTLDHFTTLFPHLRLTQVTLQDQTDHRNELVQENHWLLHPSEAGLALTGNVFAIEETISGDGILFLKEAPLPHARPNPSKFDFKVEEEWIGPWRFTFAGGGRDGIDPGYRWITLAYTGGWVGRTAALQDYQRQLRIYAPERGATILCNYWGDRSRDKIVCEAFYQQEIDAAARLGVDVIQIDDGWQKGWSAGTTRGKGVLEGFRAFNPVFWEVDEVRFPNGLTPLIERARGKGIRFGLWFAPDSADDFADWESDARVILDLHRKGIDYFKIDFLTVRTRRGERRLHQFFERVRDESQGRVVFDLDITASLRPGYFGLMHTGPLFVENRYTDWHRYWPHQTFRNLWKLARWVDPRRLRMEFLNNARNHDRYRDDPLAPAHYTPDYLFAAVMFGQPLAWFEACNLTPAYVEAVAPLVKTWKSCRDAIYTGTILPIGEEPDGTAWTGMVSVASDRKEAYLLLFREFNDRPTWSGALPLWHGAGQADILAGEGQVRVTGGRIEAQIDRPRRYFLVRLRT